MVKKHSSFKVSLSKKGFTLIELLVVLGILGILAAALLAAINPIEQLRKGQDTSDKNVATEFVDASTSYYSTTNYFPWTSPTASCYTGSMTAGVLLSGLPNCVSTLVTAGELKSSFKTVSNLKDIRITYPDPQNAISNGVVACFKPVSNAQQLDPNTKFTQTGANNPTACKSAGGTALCWWCAR